MSGDTQCTLTQPPRPTSDTAAPGAFLTIVHPPRLARRIELPRDGLVLGRQSDDPTSLIADDTVSRRHLSIGWDGRSRTHVVADLGSHNGSWLDGRALGAARTPVRDGAVIRFGGVVAVYERSGLDPGDEDSLSEVIPGESACMRRLRRLVAQAAPDPSPVLVNGPTGAGKEEIVRALHHRSGRRGPFVAVNVTELPAQLAESQLFGHVRGAFTGALQAQPGLFRAAEGGTLFLDEIGELSLELQPKLLRVIQEREVRPVGGTRAERFDVRIAAATNRDLVNDVEAGRFRRDLWARLSLWELPVPPLSARRGDLPAWIARLHRRWCVERGLPVEPLDFDVEAVEALLLAEWPENLRSVDRLVHRLAVGAGRRVITRAGIAEVLDLAGRAGAGAEEPVSDGGEVIPLKRPAPGDAAELIDVLARHGHSVRAVARWYGRERRQVYRWMDAFGIRRPVGSGE